MISPDEIEFISKIAFSIFLSFFIGLERQLRGKPAGLRTSLMVAMGSMLYCHMSVLLNDGNTDATRVLGQLITGIGFLGGGVILSRHGTVYGLTSAAVIWVLAAIGACVGFGYYRYAIIFTFFTVLILIGVRQLEKFFRVLTKGLHRNS